MPASAPNLTPNLLPRHAGSKKPVSWPEAELYALLLLKYAMDEAPWVAERAARRAGDEHEHEQFMSRIGGLTFDPVVEALGLKTKANRSRNTDALEAIIQARLPRCRSRCPAPY